MLHWLWHADKAWVPAGTHFFDKQAHEALAPKRPPNSPQGTKCPSPASSRRHRPPTSGGGRATGNSPSKPSWDSWGSPSKVSRRSSPGGAAPNSPSKLSTTSSPGRAAPSSPSRAALKKLTTSWSPGRAGFVKTELAGADQNRFSHSRATTSKASKQHVGKHSRKEANSSAKRPEVHAHRNGHEFKTAMISDAQNHANNAGKFASTGTGDGIWDGALAGPGSSFLQPVLHSALGKIAPDAQLQQGQHLERNAPKKSPAKKKRTGASSCKGGKHAQGVQSHADEEEEHAEVGSKRQAQNSPPRVYTLDQSPRGSYVSPLRASPRTALSYRHDSPLLILPSAQPMPAALRALDFTRAATRRSDVPSSVVPDGTCHISSVSSDACSSQLSTQGSGSYVQSSLTGSSEYSGESERDEGEAEQGSAANTVTMASGGRKDR